MQYPAAMAHLEHTKEKFTKNIYYQPTLIMKTMDVGCAPWKWAETMKNEKQLCITLGSILYKRQLFNTGSELYNASPIEHKISM